MSANVNVRDRPRLLIAGHLDAFALGETPYCIPARSDSAYAWRWRKEPFGTLGRHCFEDSPRSQQETTKENTT